MTSEEGDETPSAVKTLAWRLCDELNKNLPEDQQVEPVNQFKTEKNPEPDKFCYVGFLLEINSAKPQGV